ncbi:MAG: efflux RND transporter periplasmic adaptor subunit [Candidatus Methylomirabilales bacterium]
MRRPPRASILVACAVGAFGTAASLAAQGPPPVPVEVEPVVERTVRRSIQTVGTVEANLQATVSAEVAGAVVRFDLREGDRVEKGQVLARLRRTGLEIALREAEAQVARAREEWKELRRGTRGEEIARRQAALAEREALLARAEQERRRFQALFAEGAVSVAEVDRVEAAYLAALAQGQQAEEALREAETGPRREEIAAAEAEYRRSQAASDRIADALQKTTILAPFAGYLVKKYVEVGQWVDQGGKVADLVDIDTVYVLIPINERDIGKIRRGDEATLMVDTYPGRTFTGRITSIVPQADLSSRNFPVRVRVDNAPEHLLKVGMFARVNVRYGQPRQGLFIPKDALVLRGKDQVVFVLDTSRARLRRVETGQAMEGMVEIVKGDLKPGQEVVVSGNEIIQDGARVEVRRKGERTR